MPLPASGHTSLVPHNSQQPGGLRLLPTLTNGDTERSNHWCEDTQPAAQGREDWVSHAPAEPSFPGVPYSSPAYEFFPCALLLPPSSNSVLTLTLSLASPCGCPSRRGARGRRTGFSSRGTQAQQLWPRGLQSTGPAAVAHGPSRSTACGILLDQGRNPCPLHWQADPQPLCHQGSPHPHSYM